MKNEIDFDSMTSAEANAFANLDAMIRTARRTMVVKRGC